MSKRYSLLFTILSVLLLLTSCGAEKVNMVNVNLKTIDEINQERLKELGRKKIFFGHQSVGSNILDGIEILRNEYDFLDIPIKEIKDPIAGLGHGISHVYIGENYNPEEKIRDFTRYVEEGIGKKADIAFFKFCYVDLDMNTDVDALFSDYKTSLSGLKKRFPELQFVHLTVPLQQNESGMKTFIKKIIGRPIVSHEKNLVKEEYNQLIRNEYQGKEPVFDLAYFESVSPDTSNRTEYSLRGESYYALEPSLTNDGGHLNETGKRQIAEQLLIFLTEL